MILVVLCACQLAAARGEVLVQKGNTGSAIPVSISRGTPYIAWSDLSATLGAVLRPLPNGRAVLSLAGVQFELTDGVPYTRVAEKVVPLAGGPGIADGEVRVPLQLLAQVLPRFAPSVRYDAKTRTLNVGTPAQQVAGAGAGGVRTVALGAVPARLQRRIVVDAGHGGPDEGTSAQAKEGGRITEKSITLAVSALLAEELGRRGFEVIQTRKRDTLIALHDRGSLANAKAGDAFVSIHVNSAGASGAGARGVETYFLSVARTEDARRLQAIENSSVRFEEDAGRSARSDPLSFILNDMKQNDHLRESSAMAEQIQRSLSKAHPGGDRGVKQAEFAVLVGSFMPSVLVEIGFLSNQSDAAFMVRRENQRKIAVAIAGAIAQYFTAYDKRVAASGVGR
jgi:N-acetylmuramoyl-L-alanine amidase